MFSLFRKQAAKPTIKDVESSPTPYDWRDTNPVVSASLTADANRMSVAAAATGEDEAQREYEEFCTHFYFKPETNLMEFIKAEHVTRLRDWLHWSNPEPEPKAFIRLALAMMRQGLNLWEQPGISMMFKGRWSQGGMPNQESQDALSVLAQVIEKPIKVFFQERPDAEMKVLDFKP